MDQKFGIFGFCTVFLTVGGDVKSATFRLANPEGGSSTRSLLREPLTDLAGVGTF